MMMMDRSLPFSARFTVCNCFCPDAICRCALYATRMRCCQDYLCGREPGLTEDMQSILNELTALSKAENSKVALRARQVLIAANQPPYELRRNQVESIFLSAIDFWGHKFNPENLQVINHPTRHLPS